MLTRTEGKQLKLHMITIEDLVPEDHFLRKLERHMDFNFIYHETACYYSANNGRPSIDPVILIKYLRLRQVKFAKRDPVTRGVKLPG